MDELTAEQAVEEARGLTFENVWAMVVQTQKMIQETQAAQKETAKQISDLSKNVGGISNKLGKFTEAMFASELWEKFNRLGYSFTSEAPRMRFYENGQVLAEVDFFLENGIYAMPVEIKTELLEADVEDHIDRIEKIRHYMDSKNDNRKLVGAVAGGIVSESVLRYAQKRGLFVIQQNGDSVSIAASPVGFKVREW